MSPQSTGHQRDFSLSLFVGALSILVFLALHPIVLQFFSTRFLGGSYGDGGLYVWLTQSFIADPSAALRLETNGMYPYPLTRAWSDSFLLPSFLGFLLGKIGITFAASYNIVLLAALGANAGAAYLLARRVGVYDHLAMAVGLIFANGSYFVGNLGHPQLLFFFWVPLAWSLVLARGESERIPARKWFQSALCVSAAFYCSVYYAIFAALGLGVLWLIDYLRGAMSQRRALRTLLLAMLGATPIIYALPSYLAVQGYFGKRGVYEAEAFAATGLSYLSFTNMHSLYSFSSVLSHSEAWLGVGYAPLLISMLYGTCYLYKKSIAICALCVGSMLLLCGASSVVDRGVQAETLTCIGAWGVLIGALVSARGRKSAFTHLLIVASVFFVFSFGPGGNPVKGEPSFAPLGVLYERAPGLSAIRAVGRYGVVVILVILIAAARALGSHRGSERIRAVKAMVIAGVFAAVGLVENLVITVPFDAPLSAPQALGEYAQSVRSAEAAVILPFGGAADERKSRSWSELAVVSTQYALWSSIPGAEFPLVNGYSGQRSKLQIDLPDILARFPSQTAFEFLGRICGLKTVLLSDIKTLGWNSEQAKQQLEKWGERIADYNEAADGSVRIKLAEYLHTVNSGQELILMAPRNLATRLSLMVIDAQQCAGGNGVRVETLGKSPKGEVITLNSERIIVQEKLELGRSAPAALSLASPHIIRVTAEGCSVLVGCGVGQ